MHNKLAAIIRKDTVLRFQSRAELLFFLVLPVIFTFLIGGGLSTGGPGQDNRIVLPVIDEDGGAGAAAFLAALGRSETVRPDTYPRDEAESLLQGNDVGAILIIPAGFSDGLTAEELLGGDRPEVVLQASANSNFGEIAQQAALQAASDLARPLLVARAGVQGVESVRPFAGDDERAAFFENTRVAAEGLLAEQPPRVDFTVLSGEGGAYDQRAQASAGQLLTWVFIPLLGASGLFAMERALGTLRRLMVTPTRKSTFLLGSIGGQLLAALIQMALLVAFGILVMKVPWGRDPLALIVILVAFALAGVALGVTLGTFVKTESQASNLSIMLGMSMALLGGAWWPMELFPTGLQQIVKVLPTTWAMSALTDITMRGQGLADVLPETAVLLGFAALFFLVGVWRFRYE